MKFLFPGIDINEHILMIKGKRTTNITLGYCVDNFKVKSSKAGNCRD